MRILLTVAYDGTVYHGWQAQAHEEKTIEGALNTSLRQLTGEDIAVIGASRTDAGVHAYGNLCVFDTESTIPPDRFKSALNSILPPDIRIMRSERVGDAFHPRHMDTRKTYRYRMYHGDVCPPTERLYSHHIYGEVDTDAMKRAAEAFVGEHDFAAFCAAGSQAETTVRTIYGIDVVTEVVNSFHAHDEYIDIYITGGGFLYNMVRIIAGTLLEVGRGRMTPDAISDIIKSGLRANAGPTLPPCGLCLMGYDLLRNGDLDEITE